MTDITAANIADNNKCHCNRNLSAEPCDTEIRESGS